MDNLSDMDMLPTYLEMVLKGNLKECPVPMLPFNKLGGILKKLGCSELKATDQDFNGWQMDFTVDFWFWGDQFVLSGSLWYGDWKFYKYAE